MKRKRQPIEIKYEEPEGWREIYEKIEEMRKEKLAPVDTMGCSAFKKKATTPREGRVNTLWSLMLSSQTKDTVTAEAMSKLSESGSSVEEILALSDEELDKKISKVGFHNKKVKYIKDTAKILHDKYNNDIPNNLEDILSLPGVGKKMAYLLLTHAWNNPLGIGVDVHVHRISNRLNWVKSETPEQTRLQLESWLPKEYWGKDGINKLLVGFGQTICVPVGPKCKDCKVNDLCPSAFKKKEVKLEKEKTEKEKKIKSEPVTKAKKNVRAKTNKKKLTLKKEEEEDVEDIIKPTKKRKST